MDHGDRAFLDFMESVVLKDVPKLVDASPVNMDVPSDQENTDDADTSANHESIVQLVHEIDNHRGWTYRGIEVSK